MRHLSQTKAAKLAGVSRGTIANRIGDGTLSDSSDGIDPAELVRVFPDINGAHIDHFLQTGELPASGGVNDRSSPGVIAGDDGAAASQRSPVNGGAIGRSSPATTIDHTVHIEAEVAWLRQLVDEQREAIKRKDRDLLEVQREAAESAERRDAAWRRQVDQLTALLPAPASAPEPAKPRGFFQRVFG